jgi:hypothetical protein
VIVGGLDEMVNTHQPLKTRDETIDDVLKDNKLHERKSGSKK